MDILSEAPASTCYVDLRGKVALVTGGGSGIGRAICVRLAREGARVLFCGRTRETLDETARIIEREGGDCRAIRADLSSVAGVDSVFEAVEDGSGSLDILVHNAAQLHSHPLMATDLEHWRQIFAVNTEAAFLLVRRAADLMVPRASGSIILVSTIGALRAHHYLVAYDASKGALESFTRAAALELAPHGIRVNSLAPGSTRLRPVDESVKDPVTRALLELGFETPTSASAFRQPHVPMGRHGTCAEMAAAVAFLASGQSSYITGHTLVVDGGATAQLSPPSARI
ncbi:MAG: dehydrogenase [Armatimonadota bacterium]|nr:MAG: dehydrogenase [Armatimonadota bacterium]